jgi:hypothetical protein
MSYRLMGTILTRRFGSALRKSVMIALASHAQDDGSGVWPSAETLAAEADCCVRSVRKCLADFLAEGLLTHVANKPCRSGFVKVRRLELKRIAELPPVRTARKRHAELQIVHASPARPATGGMHVVPQSPADGAVKPVNGSNQ